SAMSANATIAPVSAPVNGSASGDDAGVRVTFSPWTVVGVDVRLCFSPRTSVQKWLAAVATHPVPPGRHSGALGVSVQSGGGLTHSGAVGVSVQSGGLLTHSGAVGVSVQSGG